MSQLNQAIIERPIELEGIVDYKEDTVISRELVKHTTGSITAFALDKGQGISEHVVPYDAFLQVIDGEAIVTIDGETTNVRKGEMIIMPADKYHSLKADVRFKMLLTMIKDV